MFRRVRMGGFLLVALVCTGAIWYLLCRLGDSLPQWVQWENRSLCSQSGSYEISLRDRSVSIRYGGQVIWDSPEVVKVQDVLSSDIDNDGEEELVLLCWKRGRYGKYKPFWIEEDEKEWSQHIFVYEYVQGEIRPKWMSSYIGQDVAQIADNGREAPNCCLLLTDLEGKVNCWMWDSWGFARQETQVSFVVFGDNLIHEPIYRYGLQNDGNFDFLFENIRDVIADSDIAIINQETPITEDPDMYGDYPLFGTPVGVGQAIADAGFDIVTCATNHALDRGSAGVSFTKDYFESNGVKCLGIQAEDEKELVPYEVITRNRIRFALLNYTYGTNGIRLPEECPYMVHLLENEDRVREDIEKARTETDFVVVFVHWGTENATEVDEFQKKWTEVFLNCGVDVVVGTHPHALQPYKILKGKDGHEMLIYYSIGNFVSAQHEKACTKGGMASFTVSLTSEGYRVTEYGLQPLVIRRQEDGAYTTEVPYGNSVEHP